MNKGSWGRAWSVEILTLLSTILILTFTPLIVFLFYYIIVGEIPVFTLKALEIYTVWIVFQIILAVFLPDKLHLILPNYMGGLRQGSVTPAGNKLTYQINGLQSWLISHILFIVFITPTIIADNWGPLLIITNITGYSLALFAYIKAKTRPSYKNDNKYSGNFIYDFYMGIELNPRISSFDFKLFFNGRPGIIAWTLINFSFAAKQYATLGYITNSMVLVNVLQAIYVLDFFWNEAWYLKTIDIAHDHFGWMLAWGDCVWLPYMYTLQAFYLFYNPVELNNIYASFVLLLGLLGYAIFRSSNNQRYRFREQQGKMTIWGKEAQGIPCFYTTSDSKTHSNIFLVSGWWGISRHMNYMGDLILSLSYCLACGFHSIVPYFYFFYLSILLIHRCYRDEHRCNHKYGESWIEYCKKVPYRLIPGIF